MSKAQFLEEAIKLLEDYREGKDIYGRVREFLKMYYASLARKPPPPRTNHYITQQFEKAKALVAQGKMIKDACAEAGLTRDQWNRRMRMQKQGRDRIDVRE